jgi:hypothetical protein
MSGDEVNLPSRSNKIFAGSKNETAKNNSRRCYQELESQSLDAEFNAQRSSFCRAK